MMNRNNGGSGLQSLILEEARKVLLAEGYTHLSMRRIASAVGCTPTSIYLYYRNKDAIFHALIQEGIQKLDRALEEAVEGGGDPEARLGRLCRAYLDFGLKNPEYYEIMFMLHPNHMERYPQEKFREARHTLDFLTRTLADAKGRPPEAIPGLKNTATVTWAFLHGTVSLLIAQRIDVAVSREEVIEEAVRQASSVAAGLDTDPGLAIRSA